ncbi:hypothetical protein L7F22_024826 [Adiantum nelumboides]|nr:hypothetical protein [Adiantum nelumboides]
MKQFLASNAKYKVLIEWISLKLSPYESIHKYVDKFWDLYLKAIVYKKIDFEEQKQQFCAGLLEDMNDRALTGIVIILSFSACVVEGAAAAKSYAALFVFGDSYVDTGNQDPSMAAPWRPPYGISWPGLPSGRFSDGRVFTDFYASFLNLTSPTPFRIINNILNSTREQANVLQSLERKGINFGFGGSGVGPTFGSDIPTISDQIKELKQLMREGVVSTEMLKASIVLLVVAGNDYGAFLQNHSDIELFTFVPKVVSLIGKSMEELYSLGFRTVAVTNMEPVGCLPNVTSLNNYTTCNETANIGLSSTHNTLLAITISSLQIGFWDAKIMLLDLHKAFNEALKEPRGDESKRQAPQDKQTEEEDEGKLENIWLDPTLPSPKSPSQSPRKSPSPRASPKAPPSPKPPPASLAPRAPSPPKQSQSPRESQQYEATLAQAPPQAPSPPSTTA